MARSKQATGPVEGQIRAGSFLWWKGQTYQFVARDPLDSLCWVARNVHSHEDATISMRELLLKGETRPVFAPSLESLQEELARAPRVVRPEAETDLPDELLARAQAIIDLVEAVDKKVAELHQKFIREQPAEDPPADGTGKKAKKRKKPRFKLTEAITYACSKQNPPVAYITYYRAKRIYSANDGKKIRIAMSLRRRTFNMSSASKAQIHLVDSHINRYYANEHRIRRSTFYNLVVSTLIRTGNLWTDPDKCPGGVPEDLVDQLVDDRIAMTSILANQENEAVLTRIPTPSRSWVYYYMRWFESQPDRGETVLTARYGKDAWENQHLVFDVFAARATHPLQFVIPDHMLIDAFFVDEQSRLTVFRLWLTLFIDVYTRGILGRFLSDSYPCIETIQGGLEHAIWPKEWPEHYEITRPWNMYGIPIMLLPDNAWAHHSISLEELARDISQGGKYPSIDLDFRPPYKGRYGGVIERALGTFAQEIKEELRGAIRDANAQGVRAAKDRACLVFADIDRFIHRKIVTYLHSRHEALGCSPHEKWDEYFKDGMPAVPKKTTEMERLFWRLHHETRTIGQKGMCLFGLHFTSPELSAAEVVDSQGNLVKYGVRFRESDVSQIAFFKQGRWLGDAQAKERREPDGTTAPISLAELNLSRKLPRGEDARAEDALANHNDAKRVNSKRAEEQKQAKRQAASGEKQTAEKAIRALDQAVERGRRAAKSEEEAALLRGFVA